VLVIGGIAGLPELIPLVKQIILEPGGTRRELKEGKAGRLKAGEEIIEREASSSGVLARQPTCPRGLGGSRL
jgi:hypothetical protein